MKFSFVAALMAVLVFSSTSSADARTHRHRHHSHHYKVLHKRIAAPSYRAASDLTCDNNGRCVSYVPAETMEVRSKASGRYRGARISDRVSIPTPAGSRRVNLSCGERLALYWGLGGGLDATWEWPNRFERAFAPGPRVAVVVPGHVYGITGGGPGAWRVVSFNGDGHHGNVAFTIDRLNGTLVDTTRPKRSRTASR